jgi:hypothetical protein
MFLREVKRPHNKKSDLREASLLPRISLLNLAELMRKWAENSVLHYVFFTFEGKYSLIIVGSSLKVLNNRKASVRPGEATNPWNN